MRLNSKGQVTIPAELRHRLGFATGDEVDVIDDGGVLRIVRAQDLTRGEQAVLRVRGILGAGRTTAEVMELTRGE
ncbi:AbrB/MazE/SpoVT family DNA-binding domain-containing protein [Microbacterium foliorum]|uniref:AbrB/MazE/SpoVT family DNA-binding domain-containing protein n=1 Tax=Microbacterium foliorum TaxID=104336 RepID=A0A4Y5YTU7_9MICO|nr:AbrB/MazE/SpoVT family DNA-binding domain-containing protein [Microbacterium foliorum]QDE35978.1 AbrB/MazE/SpoVT family DNA-binding domain-containing protein [Microbacterium foliorum]